MLTEITEPKIIINFKVSFLNRKESMPYFLSFIHFILFSLISISQMKRNNIPYPKEFHKSESRYATENRVTIESRFESETLANK